MTSEFSRKIYVIVLSAALVFSMSAGSFGTAYALDEAEEQQTEEMETGGEAESEVPQDELTPAEDVSGTAAEETEEEKTPDEPEKPLLLKKYKSRKVPARDLGVNLKTYVEKGNDGYVVAQGAATDGTYAYFLMLSPVKERQSNIILCLDWNSENLEPVLKGEQTHIGQMWSCNDNGSGEPDAVMTMPITMESEGIFHIASVDEEGRVSSHFYVSEYQRIQKYKTVKKKVPYKVKWKKVKKKVKWKKVKGKWKYKIKKVWKYKTKYKTVKQKVKDYKQRDDYIYDLGVF